MTNIISISGHMQSGKNTCGNFILGHCLASLGIVRNGFNISNTGQLIVNDLFGHKEHAGIFDINNPNPKFKDFLKQNVDKYVQVYSYAHFLKNHVCVDILGIPYELVHGDNNAKNQLTELRWENMAGVITPEKWTVIQESTRFYNQEYINTILASPHELGLVIHQPGQMTVREVMQYVGTEIFRKMYSDVWTNATLRKIERDKPELALILDPRFPNEILSPKARGGISIRLTRNPFPDNKHESEVALDPENFDWSQFDYLLDNANLTIEEQNIALYNIMLELGLIIGE